MIIKYYTYMFIYFLFLQIVLIFYFSIHSSFYN